MLVRLAPGCLIRLIRRCDCGQNSVPFDAYHSLSQPAGVNLIPRRLTRSDGNMARSIFSRDWHFSMHDMPKKVAILDLKQSWEHFSRSSQIHEPRTPPAFRGVHGQATIFGKARPVFDEAEGIPLGIRIILPDLNRYSQEATRSVRTMTPSKSGLVTVGPCPLPRQPPCGIAPHRRILSVPARLPPTSGLRPRIRVLDSTAAQGRACTPGCTEHAGHPRLSPATVSITTCTWHIIWAGEMSEMFLDQSI